MYFKLLLRNFFLNSHSEHVDIRLLTLVELQDVVAAKIQVSTEVTVLFASLNHKA